MAASSDLKSDVERRAGSNPATRTKQRLALDCLRESCKKIYYNNNFIIEILKKTCEF